MDQSRTELMEQFVLWINEAIVTKYLRVAAVEPEMRGSSTRVGRKPYQTIAAVNGNYHLVTNLKYFRNLIRARN